MDALVRRRPLLLTLGALAWPLAVLATASCGGAEGTRGAVGVSDKPRAVTGGGGALDGGARDGAASLPAGYRESFTKVNRARFATLHIPGRWELDVYANEAAARALSSRSREVPAGAVVVAEHYERNGGARGGAGPVMLMEKRERGYAPEHGDWRYVVVGSAGQLVNEGVIATCAGCHDNAPMDGLFPLVE